MTEGRAVAIAGAAHLALLAMLSLGWSWTQRTSPAVEAVPVEFVEIDDVPRITELPKPSMDAAPQELREATAPEPEPEPRPAPEIASTPAPLPEPDLKPEPIPDLRPEPAPEPKPKPEPKPEPKKAEAKAEPKPAPKPEPKEEPAEQAKKKAPERLDAEELANLIDKDLPRAKRRPTNVDDLATTVEKALPRGAQLDARATATLEQAIRSQIAPCWNPPLGGEGADRMTVMLRIELNRDGSVAKPPEVVSQTGAADNPAFARVFADSARRAVLRCAPLKLPAELYDAWRTVDINFDPKDLA